LGNFSDQFGAIILELMLVLAVMLAIVIRNIIYQLKIEFDEKS